MLERERREAYHDGALAMYKAMCVARGLGRPDPLPSQIVEREFAKSCLKCGIKHAGECGPLQVGETKS